MKGYPVNIVGCRQPDDKVFAKWPIRSPYENTKNIYHALSEIFLTKVYHCTETVRIKLNNNDIFLGHPYFPYTGHESGVTEKAVQSIKKPKVLALITPLHCNTSINSGHLDVQYLEHVNGLIDRVDVLFGIMGEYWWNEWDESPYAHWKTKMIRLDMAVDVKNYPTVKAEFNEPGKRAFLYIGNNTPNKGIPFLEKLAGNLGHENFGWIGSGPEIANVVRIDKSAVLTPDYMKNIARQYDFLISPSVADANPTTILEAMAWGFPVVCTPQSGYYESDYRFNIHADLLDYSIDVLNKLQWLPNQDLHNIAHQARTVVENDYNWSKFTDTIIKYLDLL